MWKKDNFRINKLYISLFVWIVYVIWILKFATLELSINNFLMHFLFLVLILAIYFKDIKKYYVDFKNAKKGRIFCYVLVLFGILFVSNFLIGFISGFMGSGFDADSSSKLIAKLFSNVPWGTLFATFLTVIFYSITEEFVFRKSIGDIIKSPILFIVISSLVNWYFQATIFSPKLSEFVVSLTVLFNSIFLSYVFVKKNNLLYTIFTRMLYNVIICGIQLILLFVK